MLFLRIFSFLATFAFVGWFPIIIYVYLNRNKPQKQRVLTHKKAAPVSYRRFGAGSRYGFDWYLDRESQVDVRSIRGICEWLVSCQYVRDLELFDHPDLWQHPVDFETLRKGDCEDHSLWAWRKCHDLGIEAEFVVGKIYQGNGVWNAHTWIVIRNGRNLHLVETTAKRMDQFFVTSDKTRRLYRPVYGIDTKLRSFVYKQASMK
jgi:hypothetical protein